MRVLYTAIQIQIFHSDLVNSCEFRSQISPFFVNLIKKILIYCSELVKFKDSDSTSKKFGAQNNAGLAF